MLTIICGNFLLELILFLSFLNILVLAFFNHYKPLKHNIRFVSSKLIETVNKYLINLIFILIFLLSFLILHAFISSNFSLKIVVETTSHILPLKYKIGAIWSSQEGSILLWLFTISIIGFWLIQNKSLKIFFDSISFLYSLHVFIISLILLFTFNPFLPNLNKEFLGLNPVLQDVALTIHPPILYFGYALSYAIFVLTITGILYKNSSSIILEISYSIAKYCLTFLVCGVFLGAWWAYRELGWGGYWFFDPVENISLMPLLCMVAYFHSIMLQFKDMRFEKISNLLGITVFILVLIGTSFTRSGFIISVHSFVNESLNGYYILFFSMFFSILCYLFLFIYSNKHEEDFYYEFNKKSAIKFANYLWLVSILCILLSLIIPILSNVIFDKIIIFESSFFIKSLIPILLLIIFLMGMFSYITKPNINYLIIRLFAVLAFSVYIKIYFKLSLLSFFGFFISIYIIEEVFISLIVSIRKKSLKRKIAMIVSHFGIGLLCLSITINKSFEKEFDVIGKIGDISQYNSFQFKIKDLRYAKALNYIRQIVDIEIKNDKSNEIIILSPERRLYIIEKLLNSESNIMSYLFSDIYCLINNIDNDTVHLKIYYKPFISIIWFSGFLIGIGVFISRKRTKL